MADQLCDGLKEVCIQSEGWRRELARLLASGERPGAERTAAIQELMRTPLKGPGCVYLAMVHALWMHEEGNVVSALNSWRLASSLHTGVLDAEAMHQLGIGNEASFRTRASAMKDLRSIYLKSSLNKACQDIDKKHIFRIDRALLGYLGEASVYSSAASQRPKVIFVPGLGTGGFLNASEHPLVPSLRRAFPEVQAEFDEVLTDPSSLEPFMGHAGGGPLDGYVSGGERASWDALFFFRHGHRFDSSHLRCPNTSKLLDSLDLCRIDGQSPEICFSVLQPGSRIEPHFGVTNARVVVHLPLRVPPGCFLEVTGAGRHHWVEGQPMVFDDTFEHSALNSSTDPRGILLMDAWHPNLSLVERRAFTHLITAISAIERDRLLPAEASSHG